MSVLVRESGSQEVGMAGAPGGPGVKERVPQATWSY